MRKIDKIIVHHTAGSKHATIADINKMHKARGFSEIGYHYLIRQDSKTGKWAAISGRSVSKAGAHAMGANASSIGIAVAGNYEEEGVDSEALVVLEELIATLQKKHSISPKELYGHREQGKTATVCPGKNLFKLLQIMKSNI